MVEASQRSQKKSSQYNVKQFRSLPCICFLVIRDTNTDGERGKHYSDIRKAFDHVEKSVDSTKQVSGCFEVQIKNTLAF